MFGVQAIIEINDTFVPDRKYEGYGHQNCVCPLLLSLLCQVWHPPLPQVEVDPGVDDGDHQQWEDELEDP